MARFSDSESSDSESDDNGNFKRRSHRLDDDDDDDDDADDNYYGLPAEPTRMDIVDDNDYGGGGPEPGELSDDNDIVAATATTTTVAAASANNHIGVSGQLASIDNALASRLKPPPQPQPRDPRLMRASAAVSSSSLTTNVELARDPRKRSTIVAVVDGDGGGGNIHNKVAADEPLGDDRNDDDINDRTAAAADDDKETEEERFAKRLKKFERLDTNTTIGGGGGDIADNYKLSSVSKQPLRERVRKLLNERKPMMAFKEIKDEISITDIPKFKDTFVHIVKDWFPAIIDDALDPRSVFIDTNHVNQFQNLLKDIFGLKVKQKDVWEAVILGIDKFIIESRISSVPLLLTKLRWVLVRDIREYLISEDIRISIKASNVLVDHRIQLQAKREAHRRNFELTNAAGGRQVPVATITPTPAVINNNPVPKSSSLFSDMIPLSRPKPSTAAAATMNPISITGMPPVVQPTVLSGGCTAASSDYQWSPTKMFDTASASEAMTVMPDDDECDTYGGGSGGGGNNMDGDSKIIVQILNHIKMDQYMRLVHMLIRHTTGSSSSSSKFIEDFGRAIKLFASSYPNHSMYNMFNKLHDLIKVNKSQFTNESALRSAMASLLVEFAEITEFKTKEWILIRDLTINNCGLIPADRNPFNEQIVPIKHNIDCHIPYRLPDTGGRPVLKYDDAPDRDIPLISKDHMIDPRVELQCERVIKVDIPEGTPDMPSRSTPQYSTLFSPLQSPINLVSPSASPVRRTKINTKSSNTTIMTTTPTKSRARKSFPSPGTKAPLVATNRRPKMPIKASTTSLSKKKPFAGPPRPSTTAITKSSSIIKTTKAPIRAPTGAKSLAKSQSTPAAAAVTTISNNNNNNNNKIARKTAITDPNRSTTTTKTGKLSALPTKTAATVVATATTTTDPVQAVVTKKPIIAPTKPVHPPQPVIVNDPRLTRTKTPITTGTIRKIGGKYSQQELKSITRKVVLSSSSSSSDDNDDEDGSS